MLTKKLLFKVLLLLIFSCSVVVILNLNSDVLAATINIRDENGEVTTWGWWLINVLAPYFILFEILKIIGGVFTLPFNWELGVGLLAGGWSNITVMWPGLAFWTFCSVAGNQ